MQSKPSNTLRQHFPFFCNPNSQNCVYLDSAATSQKLQSVVDITQQYYQERAVNVHRSSHQLAAIVTEQFEQSRKTIQHFIGANSHKEIVWTKGATESINLVASGLAKSHFKAGDSILVSALEHHANIVPWQQIAQGLNLTLEVMPVDANGVLKLDESLQLISANTVLVALGHVSNALGNINPIEAIIAKAKEVGALTLIDGTQAVSHLGVNVQQLGCDFYVFSGHKMFGPTGIGVLYGKYDLLEQLPPYQLGGEMIKQVSFSHTTFQPPPLKFEAGTPNIAGVLGIAVASEFIQQHRKMLLALEQDLYQQLLSTLSAIPQVRLWGDSVNSICVQSFTVQGVSHYDLAVLLDKCNIAVRVGHHCAMPLMNELGIDGTIRVSLAAYNNSADIDTFGAALIECIGLLIEPAIHEESSDTSSEHNQTLLAPIAESIKQAKSWDQTYRQLMLAGKGLVRLQDQYKTDESAVHGCESQVWIRCYIEDGSLVLEGDSPSKIVRGLLAVVFEAMSGKTVNQVLAFHLTDYLEKLRLGKHLSQSRGNGLSAVVNKIIEYCQLQSANKES
ncbi:SufS family cysteine desulfurase [Paraglaciecola sp. MB-3u-78]|uniref:SufS family cysteine desulfurase n=1 Tax=Paraglaciecola sp. MB-3u-78 TaxID=2058332 RepID=UPI000C31C9A3|nr:SufS family cysteine desulfurase [Paraglaciecola sp. MB-3u-78]PKG96829.1 cysteine desulfurase [Paraglaciecola sp. MB-3u-78]